MHASSNRVDERAFFKENENKVLALQLFQISSSYICVDIAECSDSCSDAFDWPEQIFLRNTFGWWLFLLNTIHCLCCVDLISKMLFLNVAMFWLSLNISRANIASRLWGAVSGSPRQLVDLLLIKQAIRRTCS